MHLWTLNGSMADGLLITFLCQFLTRNSSLLFWPPMFGVLVGLAGVFCFTSTTKQSFTFSTHGLQQIQTLCTLSSLLKVAACLSFTFAAVHVPGKNNGIADALSRFNSQGFRSQAPCANKSPVLIPPQLLAQLSTVI